MITAEDDRAARAVAVVEKLRQAYPDAACSLHYANPLQLLVATILAAQCTDERVNQVTPALFARYPTAEDLANAPLTDLEQAVRSTGFFRNKARNIQAACRMIVQEFSGQVPRTMDELLRLPGVARKTANVVLGEAFGLVEGVIVDTHVGRISRRLGLTEKDDPVQVETELMALLPRQAWLAWNHQLISHGRLVCMARRPRCEDCVLATECLFVRAAAQ
jgi:endonuclease-3